MSVDTVREQVQSCENCHLSLTRRGSTPVAFSGSVPSLAGVAVVTESPTVEEVRAGKPLYSDAGRYLCGLLASVGLKPKLLSFMHLVACTPTTDEGRYRLPLVDEIESCRGNLLAQLKASEARYVLLVGSAPLRRFTQHSMQHAHGRPFALKMNKVDALVGFGVPSPQAAMRHPSIEKALTDDLGKFVDVLNAESWPDLITDECMICDAVADSWRLDARGFPFCNAHYVEAR